MAEGFVSRTLRQFMAKLSGKTFGGERDMYTVLGYPADIAPEQYLGQYARGDIAARIVDSFPDATWRETPTIRQRGSKEDDQLSALVEALAEKVNLWGTLHRLDRLTGLGHYGVLMLGLDKGENAALPTTGKDYRLFYLAPHGEQSATITNWDQDPRSPRYGQPLTYLLRTGVSWTGVGAGAQQAITCHWSRAIHCAERQLENKSIGQPRLERIWNRLIDLEKIVGGGAETWWQNAAQIRAWVADADSTVDTEGKAQLEAQLEEMMHGLRRDVLAQGLTPTPLAADAQSQNAALLADKIIEIIAGSEGVPKRILMGSERGELSSEQDENNWAARIAERRKQYASPAIIRPFIDRCMAFGILPAMAYDVVWPESDTLGEAARADIANKKATALSTYVSAPGADRICPPQEFRRWLGEDETSEFQVEEGEDEVPVDGEITDPEGALAAGGADAQATALNGAQITAIQGIVMSVATGELPPETAVQLIMIGFPLISEAQARALVNPLIGFTPTPQVTPVIAANRALRAVGIRLRSGGASFDNNPEAVAAFNRRLVLIANATPRPLYVHRKVLNWRDIAKWAKAQGFESTVGEDMHVTIAFSRTPVDWLKVSEPWAQKPGDLSGELAIAAGGPRTVERLGDKGAVVLGFASNELHYRHDAIKNAGCSWEYSDYTPHITLTYKPGKVDLGKVTPYAGAIELGPEIFEPIDDEYSAKLVENMKR